MKDRLKAAAAFVLAYLSTPTSKAGIVIMLTAAAGKWLTAEQIEALYWFAMLGAGAILVAWPERPK